MKTALIRQGKQREREGERERGAKHFCEEEEREGKYRCAPGKKVLLKPPGNMPFCW